MVNTQPTPMQQINARNPAYGRQGSFTEPTWNKPSRFIPVESPNVQAGMGRKPVRCFRCRQMGHYASECPNPRFMQDYAPLCANCKQQGHQHHQCNAPFNSNNIDQQMQSTVQIVEETNKSQESPVHRVETIQAVVTRNQHKGKGPVHLREKPYQYWLTDQ